MTSLGDNAVGLAAQKVVEPAAIPISHNSSLEKGIVTLDSERSVDDGESQAIQPRTVIDHEAYPEPTAEERTTLRKVYDTIPLTAWTLCFVEVGERASYYGAKAAFNNFMQFPLPEGGPGTGAINPNNPNGHAGALNLGLQTASAIGTLFTFMAYIVPIFGAWIADTKVGRYKAIFIGVIICAVAHVIMVGGAAPALLQAGKGAAPFLISLFLLSIGAGIFKPNIAPTIIDQYRYQREYTKVLASGEKVLVDPETTINHIMLIFYAFVNVGAFFAIATVYIEKYHSFWLAYLVPGIVFFLSPILLVLMYKRTIRKPPQGTDLTRFVKITLTALKASRFNPFSKKLWSNVKPSSHEGRVSNFSWTEKEVADTQRTWEAVAIFLYVPIWVLNDGGVGAVQSNQGASMTSDGAPNDLLSHFNPLVIIVFAPFMAHVVYPFLARRKIKFGRINRMTFGFLLAAISGVIGAVVQYRVYETSPCGYNASDCDSVSPITIWWQLPNVILGAMSEVFVSVTAYELAYARAPEHMRATVMALYLFMTALSSALAEILIPAIADPTLVWAWAAPAIALFVQTAIFRWRHRSVNDDVFMTRDEDFEPLQEKKQDGVESGSAK